MPIAINDKGEALYLDGADWKPAPLAQNDKGEKMAFDGKEWKSLSAPVAAPSPAPAAKGQDYGATDSLMQGRLFNFGDEVKALGQTAADAVVDVAQGKRKAGDVAFDALTLGYGDRPSVSMPMPARGESSGQSLYAGNLAGVRQAAKAYEEANPVKAIGSQVLGGLATGADAARGGLSFLQGAKATIPSMAGRGAAEGAAYGAAYGLGAGEGIEGRANEVMKGAAVGGLTGGLAGGVLTGGLARRPAIPTTQALKDQASTAYKAAEQAGLVVKDTSFAQAVDDIAGAARKAGIDRDIHPKATAVLNRLMQEKGKAPTLEEMEILRRVSKSAAASVEPDERRIAQIIIDKMDDYVGGLTQADVVAGDARLATQALTDARGLWSRMRKGELIEDLVERAGTRASQFSGSGFENALRTEFRAVAMNPKKMRGFTDAEKAAIRKVAMGGPVENLLRMVGKFAPTGIVSSALSGGVGMVAGGPIGAVALPTVGMAARQGASSLTARNATRAAELMRAGGARPARNAISPAQLEALRSLLLVEAQQAPGLLGQPQQQPMGLLGTIR